MRNPFRTAPRSVQWAGVILIALPVFDALVALQITSAGAFFAQWPVRLPAVACLLGCACGVLFGVNLVRLLFAGLLLLSLVQQAVSWHYLGAISFSVVYDLVSRIAPWIALILCFVPSANRYFAHRNSVPAESDQARSPAPRPTYMLTIALSGALVLVAGLWAVRRFGSLANAGYMSPELQREHGRIFSEGSDVPIGNNLRMLQTAANQYFLENGSVDRVALSQLVGPGRLITRLEPFAGESYPAEVRRGADPEAVFPDGSRLVYSPAAGRYIRRQASH